MHGLPTHLKVGSLLEPSVSKVRGPFTVMLGASNSAPAGMYQMPPSSAIWKPFEKETCVPSVTSMASSFCCTTENADERMLLASAGSLQEHKGSDANRSSKKVGIVGSPLEESGS